MRQAMKTNNTTFRNLSITRRVGCHAAKKAYRAMVTILFKIGKRDETKLVAVMIDWHLT
jgi:hypothetical protein